MKLETFYDNFEMLAEAPNGVQKLRELILQLAVQGKLVPQDERDEPAAVLSEKILIEWRKFVSDRTIKSSKPIQESEVPFELPKSWLWQRLETIFYPISTNDKKIKTTDIKEEGKFPVVDQGKKFIAGYTNEANLLIKLPGHVIVFGDHTCELKYIDFNFVAGADGVKILRPIRIFEKYFYWVLKNIKLEDRGYSRHYKYLLSSLFPLPPLAEQHRIVAKVDQLMSLCDELEARQQKKRESRARLNSAALDRLLAACAPGDFAEGWRRVCDNFDMLYDTPENIVALRQSILQLAVMGKLVAQHPDDEPASVLLEKINAEKERLIKEKKIRKSDLPPPITDDEIQYNLPENWKWVRLADICELITDGTHQTPNYTNNGRIFLSAQNVKPFHFMPENFKFVSEEDYQEYVKNRKPQLEDILLTRVGAGIGEAAVIDKKIDFAFYVSIALIRPVKMFIDPYYLTIFLNSPIGTEKSKRNTYGKGVSQGNLNLGLIKKFVVSIPPLNEQRRIVAKVDQLMSLCDSLEASLSRSQADGERLMEAVVGRVLAGGDSGEEQNNTQR